MSDQQTPTTENAQNVSALVALRKERGLSQTTVGDAMGVRQNRVSAIEKGNYAKSQVSTLASYVAALGGELHLLAVVDGKAIEIPVPAPTAEAVSEDAAA